MTRDILEKLATQVVNAAFEVHRELGPGLLESAYEMALCHELNLAGLRFERQKDMPITYKGIKLDLGYRLDVLVESQILVELKAVEELLPVHEAQLLSYLKQADKPLGFLINFNVPLIRDGIRRRAHRLPAS
jgi:GxxExxY protein